MASIYQEGAGWAVRIRSRADTAYQAGFASRARAEAWLRARQDAIQARGRPFGLGAEKTTLAQALADYLPRRVPYLKSGDQLGRRLNRYIRYGRLPTYRIVKVEHRRDDATGGADRKTVYFALERVPFTPQRVIPPGLGAHRAGQARRGEQSERLRERLARLRVADITRRDIQEFVHALQREGKAAQSIAHEQAVLREFFNFAHGQWNWAQPAENPATRLQMPVIDNARNRVLTPDEETRLAAALAECRNPYMAPFVALLQQTAMRQSELLLTAQWRDIDWARRVLTLWDAKARGRDVPLTRDAVAILQLLPRGAGEDRIFPMTESALNAAWYRVLERAGIENLHKHDLRHDALTRFAGLLNGDVFLLKLVSGHKTLSQLARYVNPKVEHVLQAVDAAEAPRTAPLHSRGPSRHPSVASVVRALEAAEASDAADAPPVTPACAAERGGRSPAAGAGRNAPAAPGTRLPQVPDTGQDDAGRSREPQTAQVISFAAWRTRHAA